MISPSTLCHPERSEGPAFSVKRPRTRLTLNPCAPLSSRAKRGEAERSRGTLRSSASPQSPINNQQSKFFNLSFVLLCGLTLFPRTSTAQDLLRQPDTEAQRKSAGCLTCHTRTDAPTMHATGTVRLGCTDCHSGNPDIRATTAPDTNEYKTAKNQAHPRPRILDNKTAAVPFNKNEA